MVPHCIVCCRDGLFELLIESSVPLPRALWLIQLLYWHKPPPAAAPAAGQTQDGPLSPRTATVAAAAGSSGADSSRVQSARAQHWTTAVTQQLEKYTAAAVAAKSTARTAQAAAAAAAAVAAATTAASNAGEGPLPISPSQPITAAAAVGTMHQAPQQQQKKKNASDPSQVHSAAHTAIAASSSISISRNASNNSSTTAAASSNVTAAVEAAAAAATRAAAAGAAAAAAVQTLQEALRLACYGFAFGLVDAAAAVGWAEMHLGSGTYAVDDLKEVALAVIQASLKVRYIHVLQLTTNDCIAVHD